MGGGTAKSRTLRERLACGSAFAWSLRVCSIPPTSVSGAFQQPGLDEEPPPRRSPLLEDLQSRYGKLEVDQLKPHRRGRSDRPTDRPGARSLGRVKLEQVNHFSRATKLPTSPGEKPEPSFLPPEPEGWKDLEDGELEWATLSEELVYDLSNVPGNVVHASEAVTNACNYACYGMCIAGAIIGSIGAGSIIVSARKALAAGNSLIHFAKTFEALEARMKNDLQEFEKVIPDLEKDSPEYNEAMALKEKLTNALAEIGSETNRAAVAAARELGQNMVKEAKIAIASGSTTITGASLITAGSVTGIISLTSRSTLIATLSPLLLGIGSAVTVPFAAREFVESYKEYRSRAGLQDRAKETLGTNTTDKTENRLFRNLGKLISGGQNVSTAKAKALLALGILGTAILGTVTCFVVAATWPVWVAIGLGVGVAACAIALHVASSRAAAKRNQVNQDLRAVMAGGADSPTARDIRQQETRRCMNILHARGAIAELRKLNDEHLRLHLTEQPTAEIRTRLLDRLRETGERFRLRPGEIERHCKELERRLKEEPGLDHAAFFAEYGKRLEHAALRQGHQARGIEIDDPIALEHYLRMDPGAAAEEILDLLSISDDHRENCLDILGRKDPGELREFIEKNIETRTRLSAADRLVRRDPEFGLFCLIEALQDEEMAGVQDGPATSFMRQLGVEDDLIQQCRKAVSPAQTLLVTKLLLEALNL